MKILREARSKYELDDSLFSNRGNIVFDGNVHKVRMLVQKLNRKKDLINYPELAIKASSIYAIGLIFEINSYFLDRYKKENGLSNLNSELFDHLKKNIGIEELSAVSETLIREFPPKEVYTKSITIEEFISALKDGSPDKIEYLEELILLWLANENPAFTPTLELFNDEILEKKTNYKQIIDETLGFFDSKPVFGPKNQNIIRMLQDPLEKNPHSLKKQLEYMRENWAYLLDKYIYQIILALDLIREEERFRGLGPGEALIYEYDGTEIENYTPDKEWMPKVVMIAKNAYVWLDQLSKKYNRSITKLHEIPDEELDQLRDWGFNSLWLIGVWERSQASKTIKRWCGNPEAEASAYSLYDYVIAYDLGGHGSYENLKSRAWARGIRLASDMVPNHTGIVSKWTMEHPDWFVCLPYPPFPSYSYSGDSLSGDPNVGIYLEDKYFSRQDAAVTFKRVDYRNGDTRYIYHGNDGTSFPWNDTAQLNFLNKEVREAVIQTILHVSRLFPIIRFDAAMTLARKHYQRLWFPEPGTGGAIPSRAEHGLTKRDFIKAMPKEFWREVVDRINKENPDTLLLAEAFWLLEGFFVRTLGMHRVYNSAFMNMLRDEDNAKYRAVMKNTLEFDPKILKRFVNFMSNPDEKTAIDQFGDGDKYFGVCILCVTMPGLPMFAHGQIEGYNEKYGMEYRKSYWNESINWGLLHHHERIIFPLMKKRYLFAEVVNFVLYDFWTGSVVNEDVFAYSNRLNDERALIIYHNKYAETRGFIKTSVGFSIKQGDDKALVQTTLAEGLNLPIDGYVIFKDYITGLEYIRNNREIHEKGLYVELRAYQSYTFLDFRVVQDNQFFHYAQLNNLLGGNGVPSMESTLYEMIYQPLYEPFQKIINMDLFKSLLTIGREDILLKDISGDLNTFLNKVKEYASGTQDIQAINENILEKLKTCLHVKEKLKEINLKSPLMELFEKTIPKTLFEWGILMSWLFTHQLGKVVSDTDYELISRSWIDEWQLSKFIEQTLYNLSSNEEEKAKSWEATSLIKLLVSIQNYLFKSNLEPDESIDTLHSLLREPEVQQYLKFNRYQGVLWYNAEAFDNFVRWFLIISVINKLTMTADSEMTEIIKSSMELITIWLEASKKSGFNVEKLLEEVQLKKNK